tara:strand:- start:395 stop:1258 length:864 start_codon:yes stop_codon:yes gene_type:complete
MKKITKTKIAIVGHGFVGKATDWGFSTNVEKFIVDPKYSTTIDDLIEFKPEFCFVCVPTPMDDNGQQDSTIIDMVVHEVLKKNSNSVIIIKSTVLPDTLEKLSKLSKKIIYNPEFLREKYANEDFVNSPMIIFGGDKNIAKKVSNLYLKNSKCKCEEHVFVDMPTASLIKYSINTFLATKITFFNEIFEIFSSLKVSDSWEKVTTTFAKDSRIGSSHMSVPGHDGRKGFGGACFPKDSAAILRYAESLGLDLSILKAAIKKNNKIRALYKNVNPREAEQNIKYDHEF